MKADKKWCIATLGIITFILLAIGIFTFIIDPYFHYHQPLDALEYPLSSERQRYINDGILRNFEYDAMIIGSSMTENFKSSQLDELFHTRSIKVPNSGTTYRETKDNIETAIRNQKNLRMVVMSADLLRLYDDKDLLRTDLGEYPTYLYDDNYFNDVNYLLNKDTVLNDIGKVFRHTLSGQTTTTFDEYSHTAPNFVYSKATVDAGYTRLEKTEPNPEAMQFQASFIEDNVTQNIVNLAQANPNIDFYIFFPPYSIYFWDDMNQRGLVDWQFDNVEYAAKLMLQCDNIQLFSFYDRYDITCNVDNYKDTMHYSEAINEMILESMTSTEQLLTVDNYQEHFDAVRDFYTSYDYEGLFTP